MSSIGKNARLKKSDGNTDTKITNEAHSSLDIRWLVEKEDKPLEPEVESESAIELGTNQVDVRVVA